LCKARQEEQHFDSGETMQELKDIGNSDGQVARVPRQEELPTTWDKGGW